MSLDIKIIPFNDDLDMFGEPDASSAYSLSGHVSVSVSSPSSFFDMRKSSRLLLQSLNLTFEGQSELFTPSTGYSAVRLCTFSRELVTGEPVELSNEGHEDRSRPCVWNIVFNLPIPGWLPASNQHGVEDTGVRYNLFATARFAPLDEDSHTSWNPFTALCSPFRSKHRTAETLKTINVQRFISPPRLAGEAAEVPMSAFLINTTSAVSKSGRKFPSEVLSKIQVLVSASRYIDMDSTEFPLSIRLRTKDLSAEECGKIQLKQVAVDIIQTEKYRSRSSPAYLAQFPVPERSLQPPNVPLRDPSSMSLVYEVGIFGSANLAESLTRTFSILPATDSGKYVLGENNYCFKDDREESPPTWYTINTSLPFERRSTAEVDCEEVAWAGHLDLKPSSSGPLFDVEHDVSICLTCSYDLPDGTVAKDSLKFKVPITFARVPPAAPSRHWTSSVSTTRTSDGQPAPICAPQVDLASCPLPAYSQLYDRNGDRKIDYSIPLPLYTPRSSAEKDHVDASESTPLIMDIESSDSSSSDGSRKHAECSYTTSNPTRRPSIV